MRYQSATVALASAALFLVACAGNKEAGQSDTASAAGTTDSASGAMASTGGMGDMKHDSMAGMSDMTGNADQDFLRMMSDHHKAMIRMAHEVKDRKGSSVTDIATRIDTKQDKEIEQMTSMLEKDFKDQYAPKIRPADKKMADELSAKTGTAFDKSFLEHTVMHHQQAVKMVDDYLPKAKNARVRQLAEQIKAAQSKEITEYKARAARITA